MSQNTFAASDATWKGESIIYDGRQYYPAAPAKENDTHGLPEGTQYYVAIEEISERPLKRKAHVIYFTSGTSPPTETSAKYVVYDYSANKEFSNPTATTTIGIVPQGDEGTYGSSCSVSGIGWVICPVSVFLAESMDWLFEQVARFVTVPPMQVNDTHTPLHTAWNVMRSIANVAFIIAFLIIIYSQLTSWGVSNYGIKKLIPRLIVAAVLVNVSFYLCAIIVDASNIAGYSLQEILVQIRKDTFAITDDTWNPEATNAWSTVTSVILSGGAVTAGWIGLSTATGGSVASAVYLLVPLLITLLLTIVFVLLILAARQAIIVILIVISPLAFVANLLPNTEKLFDKWKDLFITMMVFFPAFSLIFGGAQLAGGIIIQNANNIIMMIFGMAVQIAPLIITPILLKLSGGLLGRIAGIINNPRRGLIDRTKNWSTERANMHRLNSMANGRRVNPMRRTARSIDASNRNTKKAAELYTNQLETRYMDKNKRFAKLTDQEHEAHMDRSIVDSRHKLRAQEHINDRTTTAHIKNIQVEAGKIALERSMEHTKADLTEYRAKVVSGNSPLAQSATRLYDEQRELAIQAARTANATVVQQQEYAQQLIQDSQLRTRAAGINPHGADAAMASATATMRNAYGQAVADARQIIKHFNLSSEQRQRLALLDAGQSLTVTKDGVTHTFYADDLYAREAAIEDQVAVGTIEQVEAIVQESGVNGKLAEFRTTIADALAKNGLGGKSIYLGGKTIDDVGRGVINGREDLMGVVMENIYKGKISARDIATIDPIAVERLQEAVDRINQGNIPTYLDPTAFPPHKLKERAQDLARVAQEALNSDERGTIKPRAREALEKLAQIAPGQNANPGNTPPKP